MDMKSSDNITVPSATPMAPEIFDFVVPQNSEVTSVEESAVIFDEDGYDVSPLPVPGYPAYKYVPFGPDNELPFKLLRTIGSDEVLAENLFFNVLATYGQGVNYIDPVTKQPSDDPDVKQFFMANSLREFYLEQCTDMKHFFFSVAVVILDRKCEEIVKVVHKDACYCRFEKADNEGRINHVFYANWRKSTSLTRNDVEKIRLLDPIDPLGDLRALLGKTRGRDGVQKERTKDRKFAVVMKFPTPGQRYYPSPYYSAIFRGDWFDLKRLIGKGKKAKMKNHSAVRYQVEIHRDFWENLFTEEQIFDPEEKKKRMKLEKERIRDFVSGAENSGKLWISSYYIDSYGKEQRMVRINVVDTGKEGGDWAEDTQEASNMICYATNIHPNLVGATPGKSQTNNSGSDKRELFTIKQSLETATRDMLAKVHNLIIAFNGWNVEPSFPMIILTTLDKKTDAVKVTADGKTQKAND